MPRHSSVLRLWMTFASRNNIITVPGEVSTSLANLQAIRIIILHHMIVHGTVIITRQRQAMEKG